MATRRQRLLFLLVPGLLATPLAVPAAPGGPGDPREAAIARARERAALVQSLPQGAPFRSGGQSYRIVGGLAAVPRASAAGAQGLAAPAPAGVVERKGHYLIVRQGGAAPLAAPLAAPAAGPAEPLPVAVNTRTNAFGLVLGTINVRLRDRGAAAALARDLGLELVADTPKISMAFFRVPAGGDLLAAAERLARDPRVRSAEIEVKEHFDQPM